MHICLSLQTPTATLHDIQIWGESVPSARDKTTLSFLSMVDYEKIPLYLVSSGPHNVYTEQKDTEAYFHSSGITEDAELAVLAKSADTDADVYVVFYADHAQGTIRCFSIDFSVLERVRQLETEVPDTNMLYAPEKKGVVPKSNITIFDRVLESKNKKSVPKAVPKAPSSSLSGPQLAQAVSKVVLSGLRLRGLSSSSRSKVAIREIYKMTHQAAMFALRKYNYDFNGSSGTEITLTVIQDIVETLLKAFVDVDDPAPSIHP